MDATETVNPDSGASPEAESAEVDAQPEGTSDAQAVADAADPVKSKPVAKTEEDPEIELDADLKFKKSELAHLVKKRRELDRGAHERFQEAAKIQKQLASLRESDPEEYFRLRNIDPIQFAVEKLQREVEMREASPEKRALLEAQAKIQALETEKQTYAEQEESRRHESEKIQFVAKLDRDLPIAVQKFGLPADPLIYRAVAGVLGDMNSNGMELDAEMAAEEVADAYKATFKQYAATLKYEDAVKQYPEFVKLVREGDLARAKSGAAAPAQRPAVQTPSAPKKPTNWDGDGGKRFNEFFDEWGALGVQRQR